MGAGRGRRRRAGRISADGARAETPRLGQVVETPDVGQRHEVRALGVVAFEPDTAGPAGLNGVWRWTPIERDDASFFGFLAEALPELARPAPPGGTALCPWCVYRDASRRTGY